MKFTFATEEDGFDSHIDRSIRGYQHLWEDVLKFSEYFVEDDTTVVDIGCSTGRLLKAMKAQNDRFAPNCVYRGVEMEEEFFGHLEDQEKLFFQKTDIRVFDWESLASNCCLIISMFTLRSTKNPGLYLQLSKQGRGIYFFGEDSKRNGTD